MPNTLLSKMTNQTQVWSFASLVILVVVVCFIVFARTVILKSNLLQFSHNLQYARHNHNAANSPATLLCVLRHTNADHLRTHAK